MTMAEDVLSAVWAAKEVILLGIAVIVAWYKMLLDTNKQFNGHDKRIAAVETKCEGTYDPFFDKMFEDSVNRVISRG